MRRNILIGLAAGLAGLAVALLAFQWMGMPTTLKVAVGPMTGEDTRLVTAMTQYLARERASVRLKLILTDGVAASAEAVNAGKADLAVVRSDVNMPAKAQTVAILHRDAAMILTTEGSGILRVSDLKGRTVGLVRNLPANASLLETILAHYDVPNTLVSTVALASPAEAEEALRGGGVDAVMVVGTPTGRSVADTVAAVGRVAGTPPVFVPIGEAEAMRQKSAALEAIEVVRGTFGGNPPRPAETMTTLGVSHRLVADSDLDEGAVSELTRLIFAMRPTIAAEVSLANRIDAPDTSKSSSLPVHPGAAAYYEGEVLSFMERYGDWFYLVVMALSIFGSAAAGFASSVANRRRAQDMELLDHLFDVVRRTRAVSSPHELDALEAEVDEILGVALGKAGGGGFDGAAISAFTLGLDQARRAIGDRRVALRSGEDLPLAAE